MITNINREKNCLNPIPFRIDFEDIEAFCSAEEKASGSWRQETGLFRNPVKNQGGDDQFAASVQHIHPAST